MPDFKLRFEPSKIEEIAARYDYRQGDVLAAEFSERVRAAAVMTKEDLIRLGTWKSPRTKSKLERNEDAFVQETTRIAMSTPFERLRIGVLILLNGVSWPMASVILHLAHREPYPILDYRAVWSLGAKAPTAYTFDFWWAYTECCREIAAKANVSMRTLDRALWQHSKEHQPKKSKRKAKP